MTQPQRKLRSGVTLGQTVDERIKRRETDPATVTRQTGSTGKPSAGSGGSTAIIPTVFADSIDQGGGTPGSYGTLGGAINGSNKVFTVSAGKYVAGSLQVYLRGQLRAHGTAANQWDETTPASGTFTFVTAPKTGDEIIVIYRRA